MSRPGAVIVPAYNEARVIGRLLRPLSEAAVRGDFELIVVCNGCSDDTAAVARAVPGVQVVEIGVGSKPAALNEGDRRATSWPRLYVDADVEISADAVTTMLQRLRRGDVMVARPAARFDWRGSTLPVRSYYRAKGRVFDGQTVMWQAGVYGLTEEGHRRVVPFPAIIADDLYVDSRFDTGEKTVVHQAVSLRQAPRDARSLLTILRRHRRGGAELSALADASRPVRDTAAQTVRTLLRTTRGPRSTFDTLVYLAFATAARSPGGKEVRWERDDSVH